MGNFGKFIPESISIRVLHYDETLFPSYSQVLEFVALPHNFTASSVAYKPHLFPHPVLHRGVDVSYSLTSLSNMLQYSSLTTPSFSRVCAYHSMYDNFDCT